MADRLSSTTRITVRYNECDSTGFAFNGNFFIWMQAGAGDLFEAAGVDVVRLAMDGHTFMAVHMACDFKRPATYRDEIDVNAFIEKIGESSLHIQYDIVKGDELLAVGRTIHAYVDTRNRKKAQIPVGIRNRLECI